MAHDAPGDERFTRPAETSTSETSTTAPSERRRPVHERNKGWYWLFLVPFFGVFLPWIYNTRDPELIGMPFFYWYQMLWVPLTVILTILVYRKTKGDG
jgi:hypothetical protein